MGSLETLEVLRLPVSPLSAFHYAHRMLLIWGKYHPVTHSKLSPGSADCDFAIMFKLSWCMLTMGHLLYSPCFWIIAIALENAQGTISQLVNGPEKENPTWNSHLAITFSSHQLQEYLMSKCGFTYRAADVLSTLSLENTSMASWLLISLWKLIL